MAGSIVWRSQLAYRPVQRRCWGAPAVSPAVQSKGANAAPLGVFELSQDYQKGVADHARRTILPVGGFLLLALIVLCATLVPILRRVTAAVEERNRRLVEQAATLERSLAAVRSAV